MPTHPWQSLFLTLLLAPALTLAAPAGTGLAVEPAKPAVHLGKLDVRSSSVIVLDAVDSSVLYAKQAQSPLPIASITKLMTALVVLDAGQPMDEMIELTTAGWNAAPRRAWPSAARSAGATCCTSR
jgi:D-alanyl-D-alanine carboxypeptidase